jgi:hypothetical protein
MLRALAKDPNDRFENMLEFQAALRGQPGSHMAPSFAAPSTVRTAVLDDEQSIAARRAVMPFDVTITPPPALVGARSPSRPPRPASRPPSQDSTQFDPTGGAPSAVKQTTTFRNAMGEVGATDINLRGSKRSTVVAVAAVVALAAAGLVITVLVTRPSNKPAVIETPTPTAPPPQPFVPPPDPTPLPEPVRPVELPVAQPKPEVEAEPQDGRSHRKPSSAKPKKSDKPGERPPVETPDPAADKKDTERW